MGQLKLVWFITGPATASVLVPLPSEQQHVCRGGSCGSTLETRNLMLSKPQADLPQDPQRAATPVALRGRDWPDLAG